MAAMPMTISAIGQIFDGPHATPERRSEGPYFLNISSLNNGRLDLSQSDRVSGEDFARWTKRVEPQEGDLLFSYETRLGEAALMPAGVKACLGRRMALLRPNRALAHPRYLLYFYLGPEFQRLIEQKTIHGATVNRIPIASMGSWPVSLPPLSEQQAIAEVLGALDNKIAANDGLVARAAQLSLTLVASHQPSVPLSEIVVVRRRTLTPDAFGQHHVAHFSLPAYDDGQLPVMTDPAEIKSAKISIDSPSVLVSKLNPRFPRVWDLPVLPSEGPSLASTEFLVLDSEHASSSLLWALLSQPSFSQELQGKAAGTSGSHQRVRPDALLATDVIDPRLVSERAHATVTSLGRTIHFRRQESRSLAVLRDTLLPQLMSGKIRVKDAGRAVSEVV